MAVATPTKPKPIAIGSTIDKLNDLREVKRKLEAQVGEVEAEYKTLEALLIAKFEAEGTDKGTGRNASASISRSVVGNLTDDTKFFAYVKKTGYFHLLQRRLSAPAVRELFDKGVKIPGCEPFEQKRLNLRTL
jgi:hypothetical protein